MTKLLLLHLSDAHISPDSASLWGNERAALIARSAIQGGPYSECLVVFAGDVTNRGQTAEFEIAEKFLAALISNLKENLSLNPLVIVAPGNHDCDLSVQNVLREYALAQRNEYFFAKPEIQNVLVGPLENYRAFEARVDTIPITDKGTFCKSGIFDLGSASVQVRVFNSPVYTKIKEQKGDLFLPEKVFTDGWEPNAIRLAIMHHPSPWFDQGVARNIRSALRANSTVTLYGHEHIPEVTEVNSYNNNLKAGSVEIDGGVLHGHGADEESSFISMEIDSASGTAIAYKHSWSKLDNCFAVSNLLTAEGDPGFVSTPVSRLRFVVASGFTEKLRDPGISVQTASGRNMVLGDIYVNIDLNKAGKKSGVQELIKHSELIIPDFVRGGLIIQGDEKFGKTSLLYRLFDSYHEKGFIPVYIALREHSVKKREDFSKVFRNSIAQIYMGESFDTFNSFGRERKIVLVDDIDSLRNNDLRTGLIEFLNMHAEFFVLTTTSRIKFEEVLTKNASDELGKIPQLVIDRFSSAKRSEMIEKWVSVTQADLDDEELLARIDTLEKAATGVLGHNMVPRVPQMLLIFLQSSNAVGKSSLESGALASYYIYLVTQQLLSAGVKKDEVEEYFSFSKLVSFAMHQSGSDYITKNEIEKCNTEFSVTYYPGSATARLNVLVNARIIEPHGGDAYKWRHAYFRYLFLGGYLGDNIDDSAVRDIVKDMCQHMYVHANANALLFLAHFSKDPFVFKSVEAVVQGLFIEAKPLSLGKDTQFFSDIMTEVKNLYVPEDVRAERKKVSVHRAAREDRVSEQVVEKKLEKLSVLEELKVLFKTSEIIGQVLKEQYASIKRGVREPVVVELFNAYMRACGNIVGILTENTEELKRWIEAKLSEDSKNISESERAIAATEVVSELVQAFMFAFFQKLGDSISSDKTLDLIQNIKWGNKAESDMFLLACELNLQRPIPLGKIDGLLLIAEKDAAFIALIRNLVQMRVRMFHTRGPDLQALASRFHLPLDRLKALDFSDPSQR